MIIRCTTKLLRSKMLLVFIERNLLQALFSCMHPVVLSAKFISRFTYSIVFLFSISAQYKKVVKEI